MTEPHPVDALLAALHEGPASIVTLSERTGYHPGAHPMLVVRARAQGHRITARSVDGITIYTLEDEDDGPTEP